MKDHQASISEQVEALGQDLKQEAGTRESDVFELRELLGGEKLAHAEHHSSVQELIASEKATREAHVKELMANHGAIQEHVSKEQALREEHHATINEQLEVINAKLSTETGTR